MNHNQIFASCIGLVLLGSCAANSFGHRNPNCNPDERLAQLLSVYEDCKHGHSTEGPGEKSPHIIIDCDRTANEIERLSLDFPHHVPTLLANARIAYEGHQPEKAERFADEALDLQPVNPEAGLLKSRLSVEAGNLPGARRVLEAQVSYTPDHPLLRESYAAVLYMAGDQAKALAELDAAQRLGAPSWRVAFNRGLIFEAQNNPAEAQRQYEACLTGNPDYEPAKSRLAGRKAESGYNPHSAPPGKKAGL